MRHRWHVGAALRRLLLLAALLLGGAPGGQAVPAHAASRVGSGAPGSCTEDALRAAVAAGGVVTFNCGADPVTITLTRPLQITKDTEIDGGGRVAISGGGRTQVINTGWYLRVTLRNLTIRDGYFTGSGAAGVDVGSYTTMTILGCRLENNVLDASGLTRAAGAILMNVGGSLVVRGSTLVGNRGVNGGAIFIGRSALLVESSALSGNRAAAHGGAIYVDGASYPPDNGIGGVIVIRDSTFAGNEATTQGGAIHTFVYPPDRVSISGSTFSGNVAHAAGADRGIGGAIRHGNGPLTITDSTFTGNVAHGAGGALWAAATRPGVITNVTFVGNRAEPAAGMPATGGALMIGEGDYRLTNVTLAENYAATSAGGIHSGSAPVTLQNTLLVRNTAGAAGEPDTQCSGTLQGSNNLQFPAPTARETACAPGIGGGDPRLEALAPNGGRTPTAALSTGSAAIDGGSGCPYADQRGYLRAGACDIGAYEFNGRVFVPTSSVSLPVVTR